MKIAITLLEPTENSEIDLRFGRCTAFCLVDTADGSRRIVDNSAGTQSQHGAGTKAVQTIAEMGANAVITGQLGPNATTALKAAGIQAWAVDGGTVDEALARLEKNELEQIL